MRLGKEKKGRQEKKESIGIDDKIPVTSHLTELRSRLITSLLFLALLFVICWIFSVPILQFISKPLKKHHLIFISPTEAFFANLKVAFFSAVFFCLPLLIYEIWAFIAPGLYKKEKKYTLGFVFFSSLLFVLGAFFCFSVILPFGIQFLLTFKASTLEATISIDKYLRFIVWLLMIFGIVFEMPLLSFFLSKIGILKPTMLSGNRKYGVVIIFFASAVLTPPDVVTQILLALPLILLYELSIFTSKLACRKESN